ncbi:MAG: YncE family protein [Gemmatimonadota bacterium]
MRVTSISRTLLPLALLMSGIAPVSAQTDAGYHVLRQMVLGGDGGWDYLTVDTTANLLYLSRSTRVMVVDLGTGKEIGEIPNTSGVHGIALAPQLGRGFVSDGRDSSVTIFDLKTLATIAVIHGVGANPDAIAFEPSTGRIFTLNGRSQDATAIDASTGTIVGTIPLGGKPEFAVEDGHGMMYVNIEDKSEIVEFDPKTLKEVHRWPLAPCQEPSGLAIDRAHRRLFAGCDNKMMAVVDADNGHVIATPPIGEGVDANRFDATSGNAFASNGEGTLTVVHEVSPDSFVVSATVPTKRGARTMTLDERNGRLYVVTADFGPPPAATTDQPRPRPTIVPGSFEVIEIGH